MIFLLEFHGRDFSMKECACMISYFLSKYQFLAKICRVLNKIEERMNIVKAS